MRINVSFLPAGKNWFRHAKTPLTNTLDLRRLTSGVPQKYGGDTREEIYSFHVLIDFFFFFFFFA